MIPESLLFQVSPMIWISERSIFWIFPCIVFAFFGVWMLRFFFREKSKTLLKNPTLPIALVPLPDISDTDFEQKIAARLRMMIAMRFSPKKSQAHTSGEIATYVSDTKITALIQLLETAEYTWEPLSDTEKKEILQWMWSDTFF